MSDQGDQPVGDSVVNDAPEISTDAPADDAGAENASASSPPEEATAGPDAERSPSPPRAEADTDAIVAAAVAAAIAPIAAERDTLRARVAELQAKVQAASTTAAEAPSDPAKDRTIADLTRQLANAVKHAEDLKTDNQRLHNSISAVATEGGSSKEILIASQLEAARAKITELNSLFAANETKRRNERARTCELEAEVRLLTSRVLVCPRCRLPVEPPSHAMQVRRHVSVTQC